MHGPRKGRETVKKMMTELREAFPDLNFWGVGALIAEGDYVCRRAGMAAALTPALPLMICQSVSFQPPLVSRCVSPVHGLPHRIGTLLHGLVFGGRGVGL